MYVPRHFEADEDVVRELLTGGSVADLVTVGPDGLQATLIPFLYDPDLASHGSLVGHLPRPNDQWGDVAGPALAIVRGPDAYISPSWYASKAEHGRVVPTWNYVSVHLHGTLQVHDDATWLADHVRRLTEKYEASRRPSWSVDDAPERYIEGMLRGIVGIEPRISRIEAKAKLSQNRPDADVLGVVAGLEREGNQVLADAVRVARAVRTSG